MMQQHSDHCGCKYDYEPDGDGLLTIDNCAQFNGDLSDKKRLKYLRLWYFFSNDYMLNEKIKLPENLKELDINVSKKNLGVFKLPKKIKKIWIYVHDRNGDEEEIRKKIREIIKFDKEYYYECIAAAEEDDSDENNIYQINNKLFRRRCINLNWLFYNCMTTKGWDYHVNVIIDDYIGCLEIS